MKFWEENGRASGRGSVGSTHSAIHLENPESHLRWYFKYFLGIAHQNYYGKTVEKTMFILSIVKSEEHYRAILWAKSGIQRIYLPVSHKTRSPHSICQEFGDLNVVRAPREIKEAGIQEDLLYIEEQEGAINFKFGILYRKKGQTTDNEILCNDGMTPVFENFLNLIGEKIALKGFKDYRGGLDVKGDTTGTHTYRTIVEGKHVMFHVANMLPFTKDNPQQVERKRHIGNDIVNIVFQEEYDQFDPCCFKSQMSHIYALVSYKSDTNSYLLKVYNEESVPPYGPDIATEYSDKDHFRRVLLVKLMNGEKAVYETPQFVARRERTIDQLLREIYKRYVRTEEQGELDYNLRPFTDRITDRIIETTPRIGRKKRIRQAAMFQEKGQDLKFQKIISGHAPTSKNCTSFSLQRKFAHYSNWKCDRVIGDFPHKILCADFWDTYVLLGTEQGLSLINTATTDISEIYDHLFLPKQILVLEEKSIAVVRAEKGKHKTGCMFTFDLAALTMKSNSSKNFKRKTKQERVQGSKGCTLLCPYLTMASKLYMAVVKHKMIQLYEWIRIQGQGQGWFQCKNDFQISDVQSMSLFGRPSGLKICVGTSTEFLIIDAEALENDKKKCIERLQKHKENTSLCITPVIKDEINDWALGVLLTYNNISVLEQFTLHPDNIFTLLIKWNIKPLHIHSSLPYFIAVGQQGIEIRMASNGHVVHSLDMHCISYLSYRCQLIYLSTWDASNSTSEVASLPTSINLGSSLNSSLAASNESVEKDWKGIDKTPVPLRSSQHASSPRNRRSFNGSIYRSSNFLDTPDGENMKHSFSTLDLAFDSDEELDNGPATFNCSGGYDLHYDVFDSPNASLYRVVSVEYNRHFKTS